MDPIVDIARRHGLTVIEDAAQAMLSTYRGRQAGTLGDLAAFSFHETKNLVSGEGGALVINDPSLVERAEIIWEKGTNRRNFARGLVDKYTWVDLGSSFLPSELVAAYLLAQLEQAESVNQERIGVWERYFAAFAPLEQRGLVTLPRIPADVQHNGHLFHLILNTADARNELISHMRERGITAPFHYVPLHDSPAGHRLGRVSGDLSWTTDVSLRLIRLPIYNSIDASRERVIDAVFEFFEPPG
jgi:dTDP-4-amino-4,6-dideoxygalactose transaminase